MVDLYVLYSSGTKVTVLHQFRLCAVKDDVKGIFSPETSAQTPCAAPSTPTPPHLANKTKTNFQLKWTVSVAISIK